MCITFIKHLIVSFISMPSSQVTNFKQQKEHINVRAGKLDWNSGFLLNKGHTRSVKMHKASLDLLTVAFSLTKVVMKAGLEPRQMSVRLLQLIIIPLCSEVWSLCLLIYALKFSFD